MQGSGTQSEPYLVQTAQDLHDVRNNLTAYYLQVEDIDLSGWGEFVPIGDSGSRFTGHYNGDSKTINGLTLDDSETDNVGLFGCISDGATLTGITLENIDITVAGLNVGSLVGQALMSGATIEVSNCRAQGSIMLTDWSFAGGLIGRIQDEEANSEIDIKECEFDGNFTLDTGSIYAGGLVGQIDQDYNSSIAIIGFEFTSDTISQTGLEIGGIAQSWNQELIPSALIKGCKITINSLMVNNAWYCGGLVGMFTGQQLTLEDNNVEIGQVEVSGFGEFAGLITLAWGGHHPSSPPGDFIVRNCRTEIESILAPNSFFTSAGIGTLYHPGAVTVEDTDCHVGVLSSRSLSGVLIGECANSSNAVIRNCHATGSDLVSEGTCGGLIGGLYSDGIANVQDCSAELDTLISDEGTLCGGFIGNLANSSIVDCYAKVGLVRAESDVGGFIGYISESEVANSFFEGEVETAGDPPWTGTIGGFAGWIGDSSTCSKCYALAAVTSPSNYAGGFAGWIVGDSIVSNSYARGSVEGLNQVGGFVGALLGEGSKAENSYVAVSVNALGSDDLGGFAGVVSDGDITNSYYDKNVAGMGDTGKGYPRTTEQMTYPYDEEVAYVDWAFGTIWHIYSFANDGYPVLAEEEIPEDPFPDDPYLEIDPHTLRFISEPVVQRQQPSANTVTVISPQAQYTAQQPGLSTDEVIERTVEIEEGFTNVCRRIAERLLERWGREQISVTGDVMLIQELQFKEKVHVDIPEASIKQDMILQKQTHDILDYRTTIVLGDIILNDNELLSRIIDELS